MLAIEKHANVNRRVLEPEPMADKLASHPGCSSTELVSHEALNLATQK
jgi:hypothetical protein